MRLEGVILLQYTFEWDPNKAKINFRKHKVCFEHAASVFNDSNMVSIYDPEHSENEERWVTIGIDKNGYIIVVCHTFKEESKNIVKIRIFSARKATPNEKRQYQRI
jgi:uncharacterized protein